ncbi:MAG: PKD domain-containing protein [Bacteroidetes bacterium]|nr:PKD domain-containing protein [Bacteroidota bacterium]
MKTPLTLLLSVCSWFSLKAQLQCGISVNDSTVCPGTNISFIDVSTGGATSYYWEFEGLGTSLATNPSFTFNQPGLYSIKHTISNGTGIDSCYLNIRVFNPPNASFMVVDSDACVFDCAGLTVLNTSVGVDAPILNYLWDYDDGAIGSSQNFMHCYVTEGVFGVRLSVMDTNGCMSSIYKPGAILIQGAIQANIGSDYQGPCSLADTLSFSAQVNTNSSVTGYSWHFSTGDSASTQNTSKVLPYGVHVVILAVVDTNGCYAYDTLNLDLRGIDADFTANAVFDPCPPFPVSFSTASSSGIYSWIFGDGGTSTQQNPNHIYVRSGVYSVALAITDTSGACTTSFSKTDYITVRGPQVSATVSEDTGTLPHMVIIEATYTDVTSITITTGDGAVYSNPTFPISHTYNFEENYVISVSAENELGCAYVVDVDTVVVSDTLVNSIADVASVGFALFPIVNSGYVTLSTSSISVADKVELYNLLGEREQTVVITKQHQMLDVSSLTSGMYIAVLVKNGEAIGQARVIKR